MGIEIGKKGVIFTGAAIVVVTILFTVFYLNEGQQVDSYTDTSLLQLQTSLRVYDELPRIIELEAQRAVQESITALANDVDRTDKLYNQTLSGKDAGAATITTCLQSGVFRRVNGTEGTCTSLEETFSRSATFIQNNTNLDIDYEIIRLDVTEASSYNLRITGEMKIQTTDAASTTEQDVSFDFFANPNGALSPSYAFTDNNTMSRPDGNVEIDIFIPIAGWSNTSAHTVTENTRFFPYPQAPSLLQRLGGDFTQSDCCGVATIIDPDEVNNPNNYSHLDYHYWNSDCGPNTKRINMDSLDADERASYGAADPAIDGAILPLSFIREANLNDSRIMENVTCS